jgi:osmoprotectant transport system substrate-binding protein
LRKVSDLARVDDRFVFAGPPECATRPLCLVGLEARYGLHFQDFVPLDAGGPSTVQALRTGEVDAGLLFTSGAALRDGSFVVLDDDRHLQPSENITPLVRSTLVDRLGPRFTATVDAVSQRLTTKALQELNARYADAPDDVHGITKQWLADQGLA